MARNSTPCTLIKHMKLKQRVVLGFMIKHVNLKVNVISPTILCLSIQCNHYIILCKLLKSSKKENVT